MQTGSEKYTGFGTRIQRCALALLTVTGYLIGAFLVLLGLASAFGGSRADVGNQEQRQFAIQGFAVAGAGGLIVALVYTAKRDKKT